MKLDVYSCSSAFSLGYDLSNLEFLKMNLKLLWFLLKDLYKCFGRILPQKVSLEKLGSVRFDFLTELLKEPFFPLNVELPLIGKTFIEFQTVWNA